MIREESKMPWAISRLLYGFRRLGPILFTTGLLLVTCCGHDVNTTMTSSSQNVIARANPVGFEAIHEGRIRQDNRSIFTPPTSRERNASNTSDTQRTSHHGKRRGGVTNIAESAISNTTTPHQNIRHNKQRRRGKGRGRGRGGKGKGKHRHNKSRSKNGESSQHSHIRRNLEKQVLVRNRTLELLGGGGARILWASSGANNTITPITGKNQSNSTKVLGNPIVTQSGRVNSSVLTVSIGLTTKNITSLEAKLETDERTLKSKISSVGSLHKVVENVTTSSDNSSFVFSERSNAHLTRNINVTGADDERTGFTIPVRIGADEIVVTDYQYDYDAIEAPGVVESSIWFNPRESRTEDDMRGNGRIVSQASGSLEPGPVQAALGTTLARVLAVLTDHGGGETTNKEEEDPCERWMRCKDKLQKAFLGPLGTLPSCPCNYPSAIFYDDKIWDQAQGKYFRWRDVSGEAERLDVYKPGAAYCIRSLLAQGSASLAAQHCCYDRYRRLLTRGSGAGTPDFVSPEVSASLHEKVDVLPWRLCKGDFTRYNTVRPPNNENNCTANPDDEEFIRQVQIAQYF